MGLNLIVIMLASMQVNMTMLTVGQENEISSFSGLFIHSDRQLFYKMWLKVHAHIGWHLAEKKIGYHSLKYP